MSRAPQKPKPKKKPTGHQKVARKLAGIGPKAKLPKKGTEERRHYDSQMRAMQRAEAGGKINPKTGKPVQARPSAKAKAAAEQIAAEEKALRKPEVTVRNLTVLATINGGGTGSTRPRRRSLGDVTMTRKQFRALVKLDKDQDDELLTMLLANVSQKIEDLSNAPGVLSLDLSDISFAGID